MDRIGKKGLWHNWRWFLCSIFLDRFRKTTKAFSQDNIYVGWDLSRSSLECKSEILQLETVSSAVLTETVTTISDCDTRIIERGSLVKVHNVTQGYEYVTCSYK
jgi:hypothetical protein